MYKQFVENPSFKRFVTDMVYGLTSADRRPGPSFATSADPRDRVAAELLEDCEHNERITLADAFAITFRLGLSEADGLAAVERLARPETASLD